MTQQPALHRVDLYCCDLPSHVGQEDEQALCSWLDRQERLRLAKLTVPSVQIQYLVTRALVRRVLARACDVAPEAIRFRYNAHGRPAIDEPQTARTLHFNVSHTAGQVVLALSQHLEVGVDIENRNRRTARESVARRCLSTHEFQSWQTLERTAQQERFFEHWTLKEAYLKATGIGIGLPLRSFGFDLSDGALPRVSFTAPIEDDPADWSFQLIKLEPVYTLALGVRNPGQGAPRLEHSLSKTTIMALLSGAKLLKSNS